MALLATPAYNPSNPAPWAMDAIRLGEQIRQQREQDAVHEQQINAQKMQQQAQDQRRAYEFGRKMEFDRARNAADDARADRTLALQERTFAADNAPFTVPPMGSGASGGTSSFPLPSLPTGGASIPAEVIPVGGANAAEVTAPMDVEGYADAGAAATHGLTDFVKGLEGFTPKAYGDFKQTSIGYGTRAKPGETSISKQEAESRLNGELGQSSSRVANAIQRYGIPNLSSNQVNALTSFDYNTGAIDTLLKSRRTPEAIAAGMSLYTKAGGSELPGLVNRRKAEIGMFNGSNGSELTNYAQQIAELPISNKQKRLVMTQTASATLSRKPTAAPEAFESVVGDAAFNPEHGTYQRPDGSEFFPERSASGKWAQKAFKPSQSAARLKVADDGQVYPFDSQGNPMKPLPDGVRFDKFNPKLVTKTVPGVGLVKVDPDGTTAVLIPQGVSVPASVSKSYLEASQELRNAQVELDAQTKLLAERPRGVTDWFGGSEGSVKDAQKKFDDAKSKVEGIRSDFPQLMPKGMAQSPAAPAAPASDPLAKARAAISAGAPRDKVLARLQQAGIDASAL